MDFCLEILSQRALIKALVKIAMASVKCFALRASSDFEYWSVPLLEHGFEASGLLAGGLEERP